MCSHVVKRRIQLWTSTSAGYKLRRAHMNKWIADSEKYCMFSLCCDILRHDTLHFCPCNYSLFKPCFWNYKKKVIKINISEFHFYRSGVESCRMPLYVVVLHLFINRPSNDFQILQCITLLLITKQRSWPVLMCSNFVVLE